MELDTWWLCSVNLTQIRTQDLIDMKCNGSLSKMDTILAHPNLKKFSNTSTKTQMALSILVSLLQESEEPLIMKDVLLLRTLGRESLQRMRSLPTTLLVLLMLPVFLTLTLVK